MNRLKIHSKGGYEILPNFLIIGAAKCGTTSLYNYLIQHPNIIPAVTKEIHFFDSTKYNNGITWYQSQFPLQLNPKKGFITGEASPYYIFYPHAARRIYDVMPQVKIIAVLRNPVDRAFSHYKYFLTREMPFFEAIKVEQSELPRERNMMIQNENYYSSTFQFYSILSRGIYVDQLRVYENFFGKDAMLILKSEDMFKYPQSVVNQVFKFLNVPPNNIKNLLEHNKQSYKPMDDSLKEYLMDYYKPHNQRLYQFLGKDLGWD